MIPRRHLHRILPLLLLTSYFTTPTLFIFFLLILRAIEWRFLLFQIWFFFWLSFAAQPFERLFHWLFLSPRCLTFVPWAVLGEIIVVIIYWPSTVSTLTPPLPPPPSSDNYGLCLIYNLLNHKLPFVCADNRAKPLTVDVCLHLYFSLRSSASYGF